VHVHVDEVERRKPVAQDGEPPGEELVGVHDGTRTQARRCDASPRGHGEPARLASSRALLLSGGPGRRGRVGETLQQQLTLTLHDDETSLP
jgi:hypothetical protein